jgi:hypothetical protein
MTMEKKLHRRNKSSNPNGILLVRITQSSGWLTTSVKAITVHILRDMTDTVKKSRNFGLYWE